MNISLQGMQVISTLRRGDAEPEGGMPLPQALVIFTKRTDCSWKWRELFGLWVVPDIGAGSGYKVFENGTGFVPHLLVCEMGE